MAINLNIKFFRMILIVMGRMLISLEAVPLIEADTIMIFLPIIQKYFKMDSLIGLKGKDFVIIAADTINAYSVLRMKVPLVSSRTTMIKFGTLMEKNFSPSVDNIPTFSSLVTTSRKILPFYSTKMGINCQLMTLPSSSGLNLPKLSEKDLTV
jgi:hypothetical protein